MSVEHGPRISGILNEPEQLLAQRLFEFTLDRGGEVVNTLDGVTTVSITNTRRRALSMEIYRSFPEAGTIVLKLRKGKKRWQDDGASGLTGSYGDSSKLEPKDFHPTVDQRDQILKEVAGIFVPL